jgi:hypothetical protein
MTEHAIIFWTLVFTVIAAVFTVIGATIAVAGVVYAIKTLRASSEVARAQFWVMVRGVLANYDDVHAKLRPGGTWGVQNGEEYSLQGPENAAEWARVELYMGMFEYCETLITRDLLKKEDFGDAYKYRLENLTRNAVIVHEKLHLRPQGWIKFLNLCDRFNLHIPSNAELPAAQK